MDFRILGPLEVCDDEGREVELGGRQQRLVLAMLLLHRNEVVSLDRLADVVWGEQAPAGAAKNIQIHISRLRKALQAKAVSGGSQSGKAVVRTLANGYVLDVAPSDLDVDRFQRLLEQGRRALAAGEFEEAGATLREALAIWRGEPLADFAYDSFAQSEIGRLNELRLGAVEERIDADLALGRHDDVTAELQRLVAEHPLRERLRGQLMLALYRSGRKAEALRVYEEARRALAQELGLEPSESLRRLHTDVLADEPALAAPERAPPTERPGLAPAWQPLHSRSNRVLLGAGGALLLAAAVAVALLTVTRDPASAEIVSVGPNSLAAIDPQTNRVLAAIPVGARPASIVSARGHLWVANLDEDTVSRVDPKAGRVVRTIPTGTAPDGLAQGHDAVWAIGGDGVILRIDPIFNKVVARIPTVAAGTLLSVAPATSGVATSADAVWTIAGGYLSTPRLFHHKPGTRQARPVIATGHGPTAIASGLGDLWVTDSFENTVSRIDKSGVVNATIPVGHGPNAIAIGEGAVWVVDSLDDAVVRIDPVTNSVTTTIDVGRYPSSVAVGAGSVWVANRQSGTVSRIDPTTNSVLETVDVGDSPAGLVYAAGSVWVTNQEASPAPASGPGSRELLRLSSSATFQTDPALLDADPQIAYATCAKLLNYPDAPPPRGTQLVPEVASSLPTRSADGKTYTFTVRTGFAFSPPLQERVTAETFRHAIERSLHPKMDPGTSVLSGIAGLGAYQSGKAAHISGIAVNENRLSITLVEPDPGFPARLATPASCAVPLNAPLNPKGVQAMPTAGPYYTAEYSPNHRIVLKRNPNYRGLRPRRFREIRYLLGVAPANGVADVLAGRSDYLADNPPVAGDAALLARYGPASDAARNGRQQYFVNPTLKLAYLALNTSRPLFSDVRLRKAVNYAIDRRALARIGSWVSGPFPSVPTDQYLPPTMPGASPTVLYPPNGDLRTARQLAPNANGTAVLYTCDDYPPLCRRPAQQIKEDLAALGLDVDIREFPTGELIERAATRGEPFDLLVTQWGADYADPANFLNVLLDQRIQPRGNFNLAYYTDPELARDLDRVAKLAGNARYRAYAALSVQIARDAAPWIAYAVGGTRDLFSARIGCQIHQPVYSISLGSLCVRN